jgi:hypothetical protein
MITKKEFCDYMVDMYGLDNDYDDLYKTFKKFSKIKDKGQIRELKDLVKMLPKERLLYRYALAFHGREMTPSQVDQYLSMIEYALLHIQE